jgi:hypothetical protein
MSSSGTTSSPSKKSLGLSASGGLSHNDIYGTTEQRGANELEPKLFFEAESHRWLRWISGMWLCVSLRTCWAGAHMYMWTSRPLKAEHSVQGPLTQL